jgi:hypothetical protein
MSVCVCSHMLVLTSAVGGLWGWGAGGWAHRVGPDEHGRLLELLRAHVSASLGVNLDAFALQRMGTGAAMLSTDGKIKVPGPLSTPHPRTHTYTYKHTTATRGNRGSPAWGWGWRGGWAVV